MAVIFVVTERELLQRQLEAMEERALTAEQKLADSQRQLQYSNQKVEQQAFLLQQAQENARKTEEKLALVKLRTEDRALDLERRLLEVEAELEEMSEYRDVLEGFQELTVEQQRRHSSQPELSSTGNRILDPKEDGQSQQQKRDIVLTLLRQMSTHGFRTATITPCVASGEDHAQCGDQLSITSL